MIEESRAHSAGIDLSREPAFELGDLKVSPSTREVRRNGSLEVLEPRVMQVLVALAKADGTVVSREDLYDACWGGRIVGDDALQRCIARLRKFADYNGTPSFIIETIPRVGYRLISARVPEPAGATAPNPDAIVAMPAASSQRWRRYVFAYGPWLAALVVAVGIGAYLLWPSADAHWRLDGMRMVVTTPEAGVLHPALSPDGSTIAYDRWWPDIRRDIFVRRIGETQSRQLTFGPGEKYAPEWSPDGRRVAYVVSAPNAACKIMAVDVAGGTPRPLAQCRAALRTKLAWHTSGLFFTDSAGEGTSTRVIRLDLANGQRTEVSNPADGADDLEPAVSPDGKRIAYVRVAAPSTTNQLIIADSDGTHARIITSTDFLSFGYAWTEDSKALIYAASGSNESKVWLQPIDGRAYLLDRGLTRFERFSPVHNGRLAAEVMHWDVNLAIATANEGETPKIIDRVAGTTHRPSFRADGTAAFVSDRSDGAGLWIKPADAPARKLPIDVGRPFGDAMWSPDGGRLAVPVRAGGTANVAVMAADGTRVEVFSTPNAETINRPAWLADGSALIVPAFDAKGGWRLWRIALNGTRTVSPASSYGWRAIAIAGTTVLQIQSGVAGIWRMDGGMRRITDIPLPAQTANMEIDGDRVLYIDERHERVTQILMSQNLSGGAPSVVARLPWYDPYGFGFDPHTRRAVYTASVEADSEIALLTLSRR